MTPYYDRGGATFYHGDVRECLRELPSESVQCVVTSPPYWGLRDYGTASWDGGDAECDHLGEPFRTKATLNANWGEGYSDVKNAEGRQPMGQTCSKCGATRIDQQLGLEATPEEYVAAMVDVFREVKRVLRKDGTCWVNIGDSYAAQRGGTAKPAETLAGGISGKGDMAAHRGRRASSINGGRQDITSPSFRTGPVAHRNAAAFGLKHKDLVGIPWALAKALRDPYYAGNIKAERDRVWLAAVIDSEGCISGFTHDRADGGGIRTGVNVTITNTSELLLAECHRIWPASQAQHENHGEGHLGGKPSWRWICNGTENRMMLLRELYPYLVAKRAQALLAYNLCLFMAGAKRMGKTAEAPGIHEKRALLARLISEANQGDGNVVIPDWCVEPPPTTEPGWYLRQDIIWAKSNPMPESVTDRCTKSHEYVFLLSKSAKYHYDADAIREPAEWARWGKQTIGKEYRGIAAVDMETLDARRADGRNKRSVWTIATEAFSEAHFATFPPALVRPCILAGCPEGGTVLDPFLGSGTTAMVAKSLGRRAIGIDLSAEYLDMAVRRLDAQTPALALFS